MNRIYNILGHILETWIALTLLASEPFANHVAQTRQFMIARGLYFVAPLSRCDHLSVCRCPVDLHELNPLYPRTLHWLLPHQEKP